MSMSIGSVASSSYHPAPSAPSAPKPVAQNAAPSAPLDSDGDHDGSRASKSAASKVNVLA